MQYEVALMWPNLNPSFKWMDPNKKKRGPHNSHSLKSQFSLSPPPPLRSISAPSPLSPSPLLRYSNPSSPPPREAPSSTPPPRAPPLRRQPSSELFSRLARRGRLPEPAARRYFQQLISALRFCHAYGVSHRDVKPENLLLDRDGNLKLSDFGLSALPDQLRLDGLLHTACGTPAYTAPEVLRRKGYDGAKADAWSCGVILYVLLAGFLPFNDSNIPSMYKSIQLRAYKIPDWFSPSAKRLIDKLLDPNPDTRITIEGLMDMPWIRRAYSLDERLNLLSYLPPASATEQADMFNSSAASLPSMNAFDIISMSSGLDLSRLFDEGRRKEMRFASTANIERIIEKVEEVGRKFGYVIENKKGASVFGRGKWGRVFSVEVSEVAPEVLMVEVKDGEGICWEELGEVVFAWHDKGDS